jgi:asparagine synthetase B (glutamine-hydrolysing)
VDISFDDYQELTPIVMESKCDPVHSIEPQIYKAAMMASADGVDLMIVGESSDLIFGGMDKLLAKDWQFDEFVKRYTFLDPKLVLTHPVDMSELFEQYRQGDKIDFMRFMDDVFAVESSSSYLNAFDTATMPYYDPYARLIMRDALDLHRVRNGEPKYLIRDLYAMKYPEVPVPDKIPMPRPVDMIFKDWEGPKRPEFRQDIPMDQLTGNQKWQLWCAEQFLNELEG